MENVSNNTNLNVRIDSTLKQESDQLFKDLGLNMTTAIEISEPKPSRSLKKALKEADNMIKHPEKYKSYTNVHEMIEDILNED